MLICGRDLNLKQKIDKGLLNLHLYGGHICSSYLVILGVSKIAFNHDMGPDQSQIPDIS